jgi:hypothetical protein
MGYPPPYQYPLLLLQLLLLLPLQKKSKKTEPAELLALYEAKGLNPTEASHQAIHDLQGVISNLLYSRARSSERDRSSQQGFSSKIDYISTRVSLLEMKVDSKPGMAQTLALGVSASALVQATPHVFRAVCNIWSSFRNSSKGNP